MNRSNLVREFKKANVFFLDLSNPDTSLWSFPMFGLYIVITDNQPYRSNTDRYVDSTSVDDKAFCLSLSEKALCF